MSIYQYFLFFSISFSDYLRSYKNVLEGFFCILLFNYRKSKQKVTLKRNENISNMDEVTYGQLRVGKYLTISSALKEERAFMTFF